MHNLLGVGFYVKQLELKILYMTELPKDKDTCSRVVISAGVQLWINNCVKINIYPVQVSCPCPSTALPQTLQLHASGKSGRTTTTTPPLLYLGLLFLLLLLLHVLRYQLIDLWDLDSNRMVGGWYLPWRWHILSIPLAAGRGTGAETCELEDTYIYAFFIWVLLFDVFIYITTGLSFSIGEAAPHHILQDYFGGVRGSWIECHFLFSLVYQWYLALW